MVDTVRDQFYNDHFNIKRLKFKYMIFNKFLLLAFTRNNLMVKSVESEEPAQCDLVMAPVCGSDGISYLNECMLDARANLESRNITIVSDGKCPTIAGIHTPGSLARSSKNVPKCPTRCKLRLVSNYDSSSLVEFFWILPGFFFW